MERTVIVVLSFLVAVALSTTPASEYRSINGTGNNQANFLWGTNNQRFLHPLNDEFYDDNISVPRGGPPGHVTLPAERTIRDDVIYGQGTPDPSPSSDWAWVVGEYLAFETVQTRGNASEQWNIVVPPTDPWFAQHNGTVTFQRCVFDPTTGTGLGNWRQQTNGASAWLDVQTVYGENDAIAAFIRLGTGGLLKYQTGPDGEIPTFYGNTSQLPAGVVPANNAGNVPSSNLFALGSPRVNQQPQSMCVNILWRREHNRQARELAAANPSWGDETVYQEARRRVIALFQHFYETEYIPMLLGNPNLDAYAGYNATQDPSINLMYNTVALRYGHTQVNNVTWRLNEDGTHATGGDILLRNVFFDPTLIISGGCSPIYRGLNAKVHNSPEVNIVEDLKEYVFAKAGFVGIDLISTNMRRGRDRGLPSFGVARQIYGIEPVWTNFDNFTEWGVQLTTAYNTSDPTICDPWICGILESSFPFLEGGELGMLNYVMVKNQFQAYRNGDRFWYLNNQFDAADLADIQNTTLAMIILRNSQVQKLKCNIFEVPGNSYTGVTGPDCLASASTSSTGTTGSTSTTGKSAASTVVYSVIVMVAAIFFLML
jgi:hypothetical protein